MVNLERWAELDPILPSTVMESLHTYLLDEHYHILCFYQPYFSPRPIKAKSERAGSKAGRMVFQVLTADSECIERIEERWVQAWQREGKYVVSIFSHNDRISGYLKIANDTQSR